MTEETEEHLLKMQSHLRKIHKHRTITDANNVKQNEGRIEISSLTSSIRSHVCNLKEVRSKSDFRYLTLFFFS